MSETKIFNEAKEAIKAGDNDRARDLLTRLLRSDKYGCIFKKRKNLLFEKRNRLGS